MTASVNGIAVGPAEDEPLELAAVRELLRQRAVESGLLGAEESEEAIVTDAIEELLGQEVAIPEPSDDEMRPLLAFIAIQATRTPRHRAKQAALYSDIHLFALRGFVEDEAAFAEAVRRVDPNASDEHVAEELANARELLANPSARVSIGDTTLIGDALDRVAILRQFTVEL